MKHLLVLAALLGLLAMPGALALDTDPDAGQLVAINNGGYCPTDAAVEVWRNCGSWMGRCVVWIYVDETGTSACYHDGG